MEQTQEPEQKTGIASYISPRENPRGFIAFLFGALIVAALIGVYVSGFQQQRKDKTDTPKAQPKFQALSDNTVVYGFWDKSNSNINAANLKSGEIYQIATLASAIKKVSIIAPDRLIFINQTDVRDHGKEIASYDLNSKLTTPLISASSGFGIDDYVVSPNKRYLALWEVSIPDGQNLKDGRSRVYSVDLTNSQVKNLIYDENIVDTKFATYPLAITDTGEMFLDTFEPNVSAGWANGMYVSDLGGTIKQQIPSMSAGTYATQPVLSPDGRYLAFAAYNGSQGIGTSAVGSSDGFRQAILSPNTVDILDVATKQRARLAGLSSQNLYPNVAFDKPSGRILYSMVSKDDATNGYYLYDLTTSKFEKIEPTGNIGQTSTRGIITSLSENKYLAGQFDTSTAALGNLGEKYSQAISELSVYDKGQNKITRLSISEGLIQYIGLFPSSYFSNAPVVSKIGTGTGARTSGDQLQLQTFVIKPSLEPVRIAQQTNSRCRDIAAAQCNEMLGTNEFPPNTWERRGAKSAFIACYDQQFNSAVSAGTCSDSPLYLYGSKGTKVDIKIGTQIFGSNAAYDGSYSGILTGDGGINISGKTFSSIDFDYTPAIKILPRLDYGRTVVSSKLGEAIYDYGRKLGLNETEIRDLVSSIGKIDAPYVFVSFFDEKTSRAILPLSFTPAPNVYRNVVFYLKPQERSVLAKDPIFEKVPKRAGFTAVEVSYIVDN
mgnify:CR=1 FL=1